MCGVTATYHRGPQKGRNNYSSNQEKKDTHQGIEPITTTPDIESATTPTATATSKAETVATGGTRNTQITINLGKMVENIVFNGSLQDNAQSLQQQVEEILLRTLYAAQPAST
ncbi:MAG: hypothetical protein KBT04_03865 [Bacteroidales bacterium]|nr:hypothetical protein [Candidatus Colimorpha onthohippi]